MRDYHKTITSSYSSLGFFASDGFILSSSSSAHTVTMSCQPPDFPAFVVQLVPFKHGPSLQGILRHQLARNRSEVVVVYSLPNDNMDAPT